MSYVNVVSVWSSLVEASTWALWTKDATSSFGFPLQTSCPCATQGFHGTGCRIPLWCHVLGLSVPELTTAVPSASLKGPLTPLSSLPFNLWFSIFDLGSLKNTKDQCLGLMPGDSVLISVKERQASGVLKAVSGESTSSPVCWMVPSIQGNWFQVSQLPAPEALLGGTGDVWGIWWNSCLSHT